MSVKMLRLSALCLPLLALGACGDGWEAQKTDTYFPYGNKRTAGYGVVYVRAKMMPEKELKVEPMVEEVVAEPAPEVEPLKPADEIFNDAQTKGGKPVKRDMPVEEVMPEDEGASLMPMESSDEAAVAEYVGSDETSAEEYISQAPKQIEIPEVTIIDETEAVAVKPVEIVAPEVIEASAGSIAPPPPEKEAYQTHNKRVTEELGLQEAVVESYNESIESEVKEVIAPKRGLIDGSTSGHDSLREIYSDPF